MMSQNMENLSSRNTSGCGADEEKFSRSSSRNEIENSVHCSNPEYSMINEHEMKTSISNPTKSIESPEKSTSMSPKRTMDLAGLDGNLNEEMTGSSPKKSRNHEEELDDEEKLNYEEESQFFDLIVTAIRHLQKDDEKLQDNEIEIGVRNVIDSFHYPNGRQFSDVDFNEFGNICGFFYRMGPMSAALTRHRVLKAIKECEKLSYQLKVPVINIVSLGSGPGCDVLGLCSAFYEYVKDKKLELTLVDSMELFKLAFDVVEKLTREHSYGNASRLFQNNNVCTSFLCTDLPGDQEQDKTYFSALKDADVILVSRLISILTENKAISISETVVENMKVGALLLLIDTPRFKGFGNLDCIYSTNDGSYAFKGKLEKIFNIGISQSSKAEIYVYRKTDSE